MDKIKRKVQRQHINPFASLYQTALKGSGERRRMVGCFEDTQTSRVALA